MADKQASLSISDDGRFETEPDNAVNMAVDPNFQTRKMGAINESGSDLDSKDKKPGLGPKMQSSNPLADMQQENEPQTKIQNISALDPLSDEPSGAQTGNAYGSTQKAPQDCVETSMELQDKVHHISNDDITYPKTNPQSILKRSNAESLSADLQQTNEKYASTRGKQHGRLMQQEKQKETVVKFENDVMSQRINQGESFNSSADGDTDRKRPMKRAKLGGSDKKNGKQKFTFSAKIGQMQLGDDPNPTNISNLTALNFDGMSFHSDMPGHVKCPDLVNNTKFNKELLKHTLSKVYGVEHLHDIRYQQKLNQMMIAIGTHRVHGGDFATGITLQDPDTGAGMNTFDFTKMFIETPETTFKDMQEDEKKARTKYLWKKLRLIVRTKGFIAQIVYDNTVRKIEMHCLDTDNSFVLPSEQEEEEKLVYTTENFDDLKWYMLNPENKIAKIQNLQVQVMTWSTLFITPLILTFEEDLKHKLIWLEWVVDISWFIEIFMNFLVADKTNRTFKDVSQNYLKGFFIFDVIATIPPMIMLQQNNMANSLKLLRIVHLEEIFNPFRYPVEAIMHGATQLKMKNALQLVKLTLASFLFGHLAACIWINIGFMYSELDDPNISFIHNQQKNPEAGDHEVWKNYGWSEIYIFSLYWIFTVITTVGYGDFAGGNNIEWIYTIALEFGGLAFVAIVTGLLTPLVAPDGTFEQSLQERVEECNLWIRKLERASSSGYESFMKPILYKQVMEAVEMAYSYDHNLIVEEFELYQQLRPKDQTELISELFQSFKNKFSFFFKPCEEGFTNEAIIQLATRRYERKPNQRSQVIAPHGEKVEHLSFLMQGVFALTNKTKINPTTYHRPFLLLAPETIYGDYQILFDLKPLFDCRTYVNHPDEEGLIQSLREKEVLKHEDLDEEGGEYVLMILEAEKLSNLCELYKESADNLKYRSLDRRNYYLKHMDQQWEQIQGKTTANHVKINPEFVSIDDAGKKETLRMSSENKKSSQSDYDSISEIQDYSKIKLRTDEVELDQVPEEGDPEKQAIEQIRQTHKEFNQLKELVKAVIYDLKDGSLQRVRQSTYKKHRTESMSYVDDPDEVSDAASYYINFAKFKPALKECEADDNSDSEEKSILQRSPYSIQQREVTAFTTAPKSKKHANALINELSAPIMDDNGQLKPRYVSAPPQPFPRAGTIEEISPSPSSSPSPSYRFGSPVDLEMRKSERTGHIKLEPIETQIYTDRSDGKLLSDRGNNAREDWQNLQ